MAEQPDTEGKNLVELLDMLRPIPEPPPVSMWPATAGWIWLGLGILALATWVGWRALRRWRAGAYRRAALAQLSAAGDDPVQVAAILRRTALAAYPRRDVAGLIGDDWLSFLDQSAGMNGFSSDAGEALLAAPYRPMPAVPGLGQLARDWVRRHRAGRAP